MDFDSKLARVTFDPKLTTVDAMVKALVDAGYGGQVAASGAASPERRRGDHIGW